MPVLVHGNVAVNENGFIVTGFEVTEMSMDDLTSFALEWARERLADELRKRAEISDYQGKYTIRFEAAP